MLRLLSDCKHCPMLPSVIAGIVFLFVLFASCQIRAADFMVVKSAPANLRIGPGINYHISWVYSLPNIPLKVLAKFEDWTKVEDVDGDQGWIKDSLLARKSFVMMNSEDAARRLPATGKAVVMVLHPYSILKVAKCEKNWCKVSVRGLSGWVHKDNLWGVD